MVIKVMTKGESTLIWKLIDWDFESVLLAAHTEVRTGLRGDFDINS